MKIEDIQNACNEFQAALAAKGKNRTVVRFWVESHARYCINLEWHKTNSVRDWDTEGEYLHGDTPAGLVDRARKFIAALPTAEETKFREFMGALGNAIDLGRKNGIEVDFINPLTETMKRLSENALTDQRVAQ
ncbi:hypothetical protein [Brucella pituitosa]|uniref:hypothetical protein n=1 Tax=Brucella pituitosa TaxID=571256 RepID=UPI0009A1B9DB|nr:hypothetical protein [Brucella pituitosa]